MNNSYVLTETGRKKCEIYISELKAKSAWVGNNKLILKRHLKCWKYNALNDQQAAFGYTRVRQAHKKPFNVSYFHIGNFAVAESWIAHHIFVRNLVRLARRQLQIGIFCF